MSIAEIRICDACKSLSTPRTTPAVATCIFCMADGCDTHVPYRVQASIQIVRTDGPDAVHGSQRGTQSDGVCHGCTVGLGVGPGQTGFPEFTEILAKALVDVVEELRTHYATRALAGGGDEARAPKPRSMFSNAATIVLNGPEWLTVSQMSERLMNSGGFASSPNSRIAELERRMAELAAEHQKEWQSVRAKSTK